jgi:hypothetical protein
MLKHAVRDAVKIDLSALRALSSLPCVCAVALTLALGLWWQRPTFGMVAAFGAMSVGFGAYHTLGSSRNLPLLWASLGMGFSAAVGSLIPHNALGLAINAISVGAVYGLLTALGPGVTWIALQCGIAALVATGYPTGVTNALGRALLVTSGGLLQMGTVILFRQLSFYFRPPVAYQDVFRGVRPAVETLRQNIDWKAIPFRYALKLACTLGLAAALARVLGLPNGYWAPMTALLVLRTNLRETLSRGLARLIGTVLGAGLATLLAATFRPDLTSLSVLVVIFAWLCYSVVTVNYGAFSICITTYIAFLLALAGLPEGQVAFYRVANTTLGGGLALLFALPALLRYRRRAGPGSREFDAIDRCLGHRKAGQLQE